MKTIKLLTLLISICAIVVLTQSCKDTEETLDLCVNVTCENGGECVDGICDCPDGYTGANCESFDFTQLQALLAEGQSPKDLYDLGVSLDSLYGKIYEGGFIFYLNTDDGTGMVAAITDQSTEAQWGCLGDTVTGAGGFALGTGAQNTMDIVANCFSTGVAARFCTNLELDGYTDWFLPSKEELYLMDINLHEKGHGDFAIEFGDFYWSSSQESRYLAWVHVFWNGLQGTTDKEIVDNNDNRHVRAVRAF